MFRPLSQTKFINDANLVSYWKLDGNSNDEKGVANGTDTNISYSTGKFSNSADFNGSSSYINNASTGIYNGTNASVSNWVKIGTAPSSGVQQLFYAVHDQGTHSFLYAKYKNDAGTLKVQGGRSRYGVADDEISTTKTLTIGQWYHVVITQSGTTINMYIDGVYVGTVTSSGNGTGSPADQIRFGAWLSGGDYFNGSQDDIGVFSRALSAGEVAELYQSQTLGEYLPNSSTKLLLHLNGSSADSSGNNNNGTDTAITYSQANGKFGQGAGFNGSTSKIVPSSAILSGNGNFTISGWGKLASTTYDGNGNVIFSQGINSNNQSTGITFLNATTIRFIIYGGDIDATFNQSTGIWYHLLATHDGTNSKLYINGTLANSGVRTLNISSSNQIIGQFTLNGNGRFNGAIDEVIVENVAWSAEKIKKYYTFTKGRFGII